VPRISKWKSSTSVIATSLGVIGFVLCAVGTGFAKPQGGHPGGGHPGGGHPGGAPHFSAPHASVGRAATPHFRAAAPRSAHFAAPRSTHFARPSLHAPAGGTSRFTHGTPSTVRPTATTEHPLTAGTRVTPFEHSAAFHSDPRDFAAHRAFAGDPAFRPFLGRGWHPYHHLGWVGPVFWPYAYGDLFYYALWPDDYGYVDPLWAYGYGDIYEGIFSPYLYDDYVAGSGAPARMAQLTQNMAQSCAEEAAEVTGWPINQIHDSIQPDQQQSALLDDLGNAIVNASDEIRTHCPTTVSFTPTARLGEMQQRLQALVDAVNIVSPPLTKFYDSLSDEQKARFNEIKPAAQNASANGQTPPGGQAANSANAPSPQAQCGASVMAWPTDQIDRVVQPNDAQREKLQALQAAAAQAADMIKAACPSEIPATPPSRLEAAGKRLQAMLQAVVTVQPALADFYEALSDDQKARFNTLGKQIFATNQE